MNIFNSSDSIVIVGKSNNMVKSNIACPYFLIDYSPFVKR
jgi:hypothetical protein